MEERFRKKREREYKKGILIDRLRDKGKKRQKKIGKVNKERKRERERSSDDTSHNFLKIAFSLKRVDSGL